MNDQLLIARRLVEAGVRVVTLSYGRWDSHGKNFDLVRDHGAKLDQCLGALIEDLDVRGMLDDVTVIAWGEFGRTPRINTAGRPRPLAAGQLRLPGRRRHEAAARSSARPTASASTPSNRPVHFQEIFATLYHNLGIDVSTTTVTDPTGRPQYLVDKPPMVELI